MSLLNKKEIAKKLGVSETTVKRWMRQRTIPYKNINGMIRFDETIIEKWLERKDVRVKSII
jgi:excisionase family DNA binding protein